MLGELLTEVGIDIDREITNSSFRRQALFAHGGKYGLGHVGCRPHPAPLPAGEGSGGLSLSQLGPLCLTPMPLEREGTGGVATLEPRHGYEWRH
jgi:hypothetical protein